MTQGSRLGKLAVVAAGVLGIATACGSTSTPPTASSSGSTSGKIGGTLSVWAEWTAQEQQDFLAALAPFEASTGITVNYQGKGNNMDTALTAAVSGGSPPDVALVPDPGTLDSLAKARFDQGPDEHPWRPDLQLRHRVEHAGHVQRQAVRRLVQGREQEHHLVQPGLFTQAGITSPPTTWEQLITDAAQLKAAGITPFSLCTDVGWPVADMWQNIYLKTAGADATTSWRRTP